MISGIQSTLLLLGKLQSSRSIRLRSSMKGAAVASISVGAGGVGIGRGDSGCRSGSVVVMDIGSGKSRSSRSMLARISA